jgi:hypothetical protein
LSKAPIPVIGGVFLHPGRCWCGCGVPLAKPALFVDLHCEQALRRHRLSERVAAFLRQPGVSAAIDADALAMAALAGAGVGPDGICPWQWPRLVAVPPTPIAKLDPLPLRFDGTEDLAGQVPTEYRRPWARQHPVAAAVLAAGERLAFTWQGDQLYEAQRAAEWEAQATPAAHAARDRLRELHAQGNVDPDTRMAALRALWQAEAEFHVDDRLPLDRALDERERTGDVDGYRAELERILAAEPLDVDAWAHLGNLHFEAAWAAHRRRARRATAEQRGAALEAYQTAVAVVELSLPPGFNGLLSWGKVSNRPVHRALQGLSIAAWWNDQTDTARATAETIAWANPGDTVATTYLRDLDAGLEYPVARVLHDDDG